MNRIHLHLLLALLPLFATGSRAADPRATLLESSSPLIREEAVATLLADPTTPAPVPLLRQLLRDPDFRIRLQAMAALHDNQAMEPEEIQTALLDPNPWVRQWMRNHLPEDPGARLEILEPLQQEFSSPDTSVKVRILETLNQTDNLPDRLLIAAIQEPEKRLRVKALFLLADHPKAVKENLSDLSAILEKGDELERFLALEIFASLGRNPGDQLLVALDDPNPIVRGAAEQLLDNLPSTEEVERLRQAYQGKQLPKEGWRFQLDPEDQGMEAEWFAAGLDDSDWEEIGIEAAWQEFDYDYIGPAWYRREIEVPELLTRADRLEIAFQGVDETARVWVDGEFVGEHDQGSGGWNVPFSLDITDIIQPGETHQITVRVENTAGAGGIWQPVWIRPAAD